MIKFPWSVYPSYFNLYIGMWAKKIWGFAIREQILYQFSVVESGKRTLDAYEYE